MLIPTNVKTFLIGQISQKSFSGQRLSIKYKILLCVVENDKRKTTGKLGSILGQKNSLFASV